MSDDKRLTVEFIEKIDDLLDWHVKAPPNYDNEAQQAEAMRLFRERREWGSYHEEAVTLGQNVAQRLTQRGIEPAAVLKVVRRLSSFVMDDLAELWDDVRDKIVAKAMMLDQLAEAPTTSTVPEQPLTPLTANDEKILLALNDSHPVALTQEDIGGKTDLSRGTVSERLTYLRQHNLTQLWAKGKRMGEIITERGKLHIARHITD